MTSDGPVHARQCTVCWNTLPLGLLVLAFGVWRPTPRHEGIDDGGCWTVPGWILGAKVTVRRLVHLENKYWPIHVTLLPKVTFTSRVHESKAPSAGCMRVLIASENPPPMF